MFLADSKKEMERMGETPKEKSEGSGRDYLMFPNCLFHNASMGGDASISQYAIKNVHR